MNGEKLLNKKMQRLNILKGTLVSRECENKEDLIKEIRDTVDDIELILEDSQSENIKDKYTEDYSLDQVRHDEIMEDETVKEVAEEEIKEDIDEINEEQPESTCTDDNSQIDKDV